MYQPHGLSRLNKWAQKRKTQEQLYNVINEAIFSILGFDLFIVLYTYWKQIEMFDLLSTVSECWIV